MSIPDDLELRPAELAPALRDAIDRLLQRAVNSNGLDDFRKAREEHISEYSSYVKALSNFVLQSVGDSGSRHAQAEAIAATD